MTFLTENDLLENDLPVERESSNLHDFQRLHKPDRLNDLEMTFDLDVENHCRNDRALFHHSSC